MRRARKRAKSPMQKRALIVDTESETCDLIEKVLTSVGIDSLTLNRSSEAPEILREGKFAVAFFALRMTSPDGPELTRQMRDSTFNRMTPVVLISDDQRPTAVSQGFEAGASFFLYKPIDKERLLRLVRATQASAEHERRRTRRVPVKSRVFAVTRLAADRRRERGCQHGRRAGQGDEGVSRRLIRQCRDAFVPGHAAGCRRGLRCAAQRGQSNGNPSGPA